MSRRGSAKPRPPAGRSGSSQVSYARKPFDKEPHWGVQTVHKLPKKIPDEAMMAAKAMFFSLDRDNSGSIDAVELGVMLRALGQNPTEEELKALIDSVDGADGDEADGQIQLREFLKLYTMGLDNKKYAGPHSPLRLSSQTATPRAHLYALLSRPSLGAPRCAQQGEPE